MRRRILWVAPLVAALALLAGCGNPAGDGGVTSGIRDEYAEYEGYAWKGLLGKWVLETEVEARLVLDKLGYPADNMTGNEMVKAAMVYELRPPENPDEDAPIGAASCWNLYDLSDAVPDASMPLHVSNGYNLGYNEKLLWSCRDGELLIGTADFYDDIDCGELDRIISDRSFFIAATMVATGEEVSLEFKKRDTPRYDFIGSWEGSFENSELPESLEDGEYYWLNSKEFMDIRKDGTVSYKSDYKDYSPYPKENSGHIETWGTWTAFSFDSISWKGHKDFLYVIYNNGSRSFIPLPIDGWKKTRG